MQAAGSSQQQRTNRGRREEGKDAAIFGQIQMPLTRTPFVGESLQRRVASRSALPLPLLLYSLFFFFSHSPLPGSFVALCAVAISVFVCVKAAARISPNSTFNTCKFLGQQRQHLWRPPPHFSLSSLPPFCILFLFAGRGNRVLLRWARMVTCRDSCFNLL